MRVVSANLQHGLPDPLGRPDIAHAVPPLRALEADVYAFQELDHRRWRTRFEHQGERLAEALGTELVWARAKQWLWAGQANALLVHGEVQSQEVVALPGAGERRIAIVAEIVVRGARWSVANAHLSLDPFIAELQLEAALAALADHPVPRVLLGDLNLRPERVAPMATSAGFALLDGPPTHNARTGLNCRLDHVLTRGSTVTDSGVGKLPVSDHLAIWADLAPRSGRCVQ